MRELYPLKFRPIPKEMIWGGNNLNRFYNKPFPLDKRVGESWEISTVKGSVSVVENGFLKGNNLSELIEIYMGDLVGDTIFEKFGHEFPLLIKLIDATNDLSVQVHPGDDIAWQNHESMGKTEFWHILEAAPGAAVINGFNSEYNKQEFIQILEKGELKLVLNRVGTEKGDCFFIPAGRVHAICKGVVLAEIQQSSDITYRIYDWDRVDENGNGRELHTIQALEAIDFSINAPGAVAAELDQEDKQILADSNYFTVRKLSGNGNIEADYTLFDSFIIYICISGQIVLNDGNSSVPMSPGDFVLIPASVNQLVIETTGAFELLEVFIKT